MAKGFRELFIGFALLGLLFLALFQFAITMQSENNADEQLINNTVINQTYLNLEDTLGGMRDQAQTQRELFETENPTVGFGSLILFSVVSTGKIFTGITVGLFNILIAMPMSILGLDPAVAGVLSTILILSIILGLWVLYKLGG